MRTMLKSARRKRWTAWFAMWLLALSACLPVVAQAVVRAQGGTDWLQVCTSTGMVWMNAQGEQRDAGEAPAASGTAQCDWCLLHGGAGGLPPADMAGTLPSAAVAIWFTAAPADPVLAALWPPAQSRAPPFTA